VPDAISGYAARLRMGGGLGGATGLDRGAVQVPVVGPGAGAQGPTFGDTLKQFVSGVSESQDAAGDLRDKFLRGEPVELHQVMAAGEEASLSLELMVELRNKVTEAYRQLVNIQS
jgi:flagellar hook-basal body complex protein FliE